MSNVHDYGKIIFVGRLNKVYSGDGKGLRGQAVKTSPFHGGNTGSIPVGVSRVWNSICRCGSNSRQSRLIKNQLRKNRIRRCGSIGRAADL